MNEIGIINVSVWLEIWQRDLFGAHTYARIDRPGVFHSDWGSSAIKVVHIK